MFGHGTKTKARTERKHVTITMEILPTLPGECVPVCVDLDVWEMVLKEQTHPTNRVNAHTALPHYSLYFDLTFKGQGFSPSKEMQRKTTTLQLSMSEKQLEITFYLTCWLISVFFRNYFLHELLAQTSELFPNNISNSSTFYPCSFSGSLQALRRWMPQENHSQWGVASSCTWTDETTESPIPVAWSMCLCPTPTWQLRSWRSTVSAVIHTLQSWIRFQISIE